jgi:hypothetical protein
MTDTYGDQLRSIAGVLERAGFSPSVRGNGRARFVYAEHGGRAVELFEEPAEISMRDYQQDTPQHAAEQAVDWLSRRNVAS